MSDEYHDTNLTYGNGYECGECASLEMEIKRIRIELDHRRSVMSRFPFCPDHRDKVAGKECRECEIEQSRSLLSAREAALEKANERLKSAYQYISWLYEKLSYTETYQNHYMLSEDEFVQRGRRLREAMYATSAETARGEGGEAK